jgi:hypothetical protein
MNKLGYDMNVPSVGTQQETLPVEPDLNQQMKGVHFGIKTRPGKCAYLEENSR